MERVCGVASMRISMGLPAVAWAAAVLLGWHVFLFGYSVITIALAEFLPLIGLPGGPAGVGIIPLAFAASLLLAFLAGRAFRSYLLTMSSIAAYFILAALAVSALVSVPRPFRHMIE
jgi:hypothetical protein